MLCQIFNYVTITSLFINHFTGCIFKMNSQYSDEAIIEQICNMDMSSYDINSYDQYVEKYNNLFSKLSERGVIVLDKKMRYNKLINNKIRPGDLAMCYPISTGSKVNSFAQKIHRKDFLADFSSIPCHVALHIEDGVFIHAEKSCGVCLVSYYELCEGYNVDFYRPIEATNDQLLAIKNAALFFHKQGYSTFSAITSLNIDYSIYCSYLAAAIYDRIKLKFITMEPRKVKPHHFIDYYDNKLSKVTLEYLKQFPLKDDKIGLGAFKVNEELKKVIEVDIVELCRKNIDTAIEQLEILIRMNSSEYFIVNLNNELLNQIRFINPSTSVQSDMKFSNNAFVHWQKEKYNEQPEE